MYEFDVLEKRFTDRFVHGRPTIKLEILEVKYREFSYSIANVERVVDPKVSYDAILIIILLLRLELANISHL